jgi:hypothetical protein
MVNIVIVACPRCEGEGKELDLFDIPKPFHDRVILRSEDRLSRSGRKITRATCQLCRGDGKMQKII